MFKKGILIFVKYDKEIFSYFWFTCAALNNIGFPSQPVYGDIFSDNIDKMTAITKLLQEKYAEFTLHVNRQQSSSAINVINVINDVNDL